MIERLDFDMLLENKKILIMGIRNKWSIAYGIAKSAYENGAKLIFTFMGEDNRKKIEELVSDFAGSKCYCLNGASEDELVEECFKKIKEENGKVDGIVHAIAHANTEDLHNDFIYTSKEGFAHACDVSSYSFVLVARMAKQMDLLNENASLVTLTYHGSTKVLEGYNVMGVAKAALETSVRYLAENLGKEGVRVNAVSAGPIKTLSAKGIKDFGSILSIVEEKAPLHKNVTTSQVGDVATFLLSGMSSCVTGHVLYADNGYNIMGV
jgi:enoyl-[acyl-carrier protein] reductase I